MLNYKEFVEKDKSMVIAPAGYGKTHTISESLLHTSGKQLILTHTHAGVASIKEKLKKQKVSNSLYNVETITSYAQKYVKGFYTKNDVPNQEDGKIYYPFIIEKATQLIGIKPISEVVSQSYNGLFVDEYQDCTIEQHKFIQALSALIPTRILGDYLQGIFDFAGTIVDLEDKNFFKEFVGNKYELTEPWRWKTSNPKLGENLKEIRVKLLASEEIILDSYGAIEFVKIDAKYFRNFQSNYYKVIWNLIKEESLLIIHPDSTSIHARLKILQNFKNNFRLIESIDAKLFYSISKEIDSSSNKTISLIIRSICLKLFNKTAMNKWFNRKGLKRKSGDKEKKIILPIQNLIQELENSNSINNKIINQIIIAISKLPSVICYRPEVFKNLCSSLIQAHKEKITVHDAMLQKRNQVRMLGRKIYGKCIGTTLLTKGLEFDTVLVLHAEKFKCPKHFYVALTRASKRLIIISQKTNLKF